MSGLSIFTFSRSWCTLLSHKTGVNESERKSKLKAKIPLTTACASAVPLSIIDRTGVLLAHGGTIVHSGLGGTRDCAIRRVTKHSALLLWGGKKQQPAALNEVYVNILRHTSCTVFFWDCCSLKWFVVCCYKKRIVPKPRYVSLYSPYPTNTARYNSQ